MRISKIVILFTISLWGLLGQSLVAQERSEAAIRFLAPFDKPFHTVLYKMQIQFGKNDFSGLLVVKNDSEKSEYNIVCLSEVGLNIMEYKYSKGKIELVKHTALFKNKRVFKMMKKYFILLLQDVEANKIKEKVLDDGFRIKTKLSQASGAKGRSFYQYNKNYKLEKIYTRGWLPFRFTIESEDNTLPTKVLFSQKLLNLSIRLDLLKQD